MELGDADDPMNAWHFGERAELFSYSLIGTHPTMSGFTAIMPRATLAALAAEQPAELPAVNPGWEVFSAALRAGSAGGPTAPALPLDSPFLFAGTVLDAPAVAVYVLKRAGVVTGLSISSEAAE
jgi:hypothetical protein